MRILVVQESDWLKRNPVQQHHMLERLSAQGHEVLVLDYPIRWRDERGRVFSRRRVHQGVARVVPESGVTVIRTAGLRVPGLGKLVWLASNTWELMHSFRRFHPDVVVVLGLSNSFVAQWLAQLAGVPVVVHLLDALHTLADPRILRPLAASVERAILRKADRVVVINKALARYAEAMGADPHRIDIIPTGVDLARFGPHVDASIVRQQFGIDPNDCVMLFVGWLYTFSGLKELAEAMVADVSIPPRLKLLVVGTGDLAPDLRHLRDTGLGNRLILADAQPVGCMPEFLAAADICLLPAHVNDTMAHVVPAKVYEYLAAGKPILASRLPGLQAEFGCSGAIRYTDGAPDLLAKACQLMGDESMRAAAGADARRLASLSGTWDSASTRFLSSISGGSSLSHCNRLTAS